MGSMADLKVNYALLQHSEQTLHVIARELEDANARRDANADIWGTPEVAAAMEEFVNNWDTHRTTLVESLHGVGRLCAMTRETVSGADQQLGAQLTDATGG